MSVSSKLQNSKARLAGFNDDAFYTDLCRRPCTWQAIR